MKKVKKFFKKHGLLLGIAACIIVVALAVAGYYFYQYENTQQLLKNPIISGQVELEDLENKVGKLVYLPTGETPTIATVSDYKKLQRQPFFKQAKNGFKVLIYAKSQIAVLYDPFTNRVVNIGPVTTGQKPAAPQNINVAIYNGTPVQGLTTIIEQELKNKLPNTTVVKKSNANAYYPKTLVIDLTKKDPTTTSQIATFLGGQVVPTPPLIEKLPTDADVLVILGKNN